MATYEIEIKSLLGSPENADALRQKLLGAGGSLVGKNKQLNHYFIAGDMQALAASVAPRLSEGQQEALRHIASAGKDFSVRTREADGAVFLVVKASVDDTTSANGISRMEFQEEIPGLSLDQLDALLLDAGFTYQAKWSREREEYECKGKGCTVTVDKNAGYGYVAEFERVVGEDADRDAVESELRAFMEEIGAAELPQDRLERMFAHYNAHWPEYYGTDNIFTID